MKRLGLIVFSALFLGGCQLLQNIPFLNKAVEKTQNEVQKVADNQPFSGSVQAAMALGVPMKCTYTMDGQQQGTAYIKGKNFYSEYAVEDVTGYSIVKDNCFWSWSADQKQGATMCMDDLATPSPGTTEPTEAPSIWDNEDIDVPETDMNCVPALVNDSMFTPPADIQFANLGETMQKMQKSFETMELEGVDMEELKKMMPQQ